MDVIDDAIRTLKGETRARTKVLGSIFLAEAAPVQTAAGAEEFIRRVRVELFDATHHCSAWRLGPGPDRYRLHDDGEPAGTAGRPILAAIDRAGLADVVVVVTRWFGGTKLGVGGLARAYGQAADLALAAGDIVTRFEHTLLTVTFTHDRTSAVMRAAALAGARIAGTTYDHDAHLVLEIRRSRADALRSALVEATRGTAVITILPAPADASEASGS